MDKFLRELIERKKAEMTELQARSEKSEDVAEVRAIGGQLEAIKKEIEAAEEQLRALPVDNDPVPADAQLRNAQVVGSFGARGAQPEEDNMEYRQAFMEYVLRGTPIPTELRDNENTLTSDVATAIPTVLVNKIIEKMEKVGMILPLITRTSYAAGVIIPTSTLKPVATWVGKSGNLTGEGLGSDRQKKTTGQVVFTYHKLRCEISMSMEVGTMAISAFEAKFVENVSKAMVKAIEAAVINGDGTNQPKGILAETAPDGQAVTVTGGAISYATLIEMESAIPEEYEATAKWCMSKKSFMSLMGIVDDNGQPVARVTYGISGKIERTLLGRDVVIASTYMPNFAAATANTFAFAFDFSDYVLNTIYDMGISKKQDWDTEDLLTKAVMSVDGKVVSKDSLVTVSNVLAG